MILGLQRTVSKKQFWGKQKSGGSLWEALDQLTIEDSNSVHPVGVVSGALTLMECFFPFSEAHGVPHWGGDKRLPRIICWAAQDQLVTATL